MKRIGLISDTHSHWDDRYVKYFGSCDEIWHAGDIGSLAVADGLARIAPLNAVYGNIDTVAIRREYPLVQRCIHTMMKMVSLSLRLSFLSAVTRIYLK